jgi:DNA modification methylase
MTDKHQIADDLTTLAYPIEKLKHLDGNPRKGNIEAVKKSYKKFGQRKPIVATKDGEVISGNHQLAAAKELGWNKIAVVFTDDDELTAKAFALADNRTADLGSYDDDLLADMLGAVSSDLEMLEATSFTENDLFQLIEPKEIKEKGVIEKKDNANTKLGDIYKLNNHILICGDAKEINNYKQQSKITFTSPPYNLGKVVYSKVTKYNNNSDNDIDYLDLLIQSTQNALENSEYVFYNVQHLSNNKIDLIEYLYNFKDNFVDTIIWDKKLAEPAMAEYVLNSRFEYIFIFSKKTNKRVIKSGNYFRGTIDNIYTELGRRGVRDEYSKIHKAVFPTHLAEFIIKNFSLANDYVIDNFMGVGTSLIVCENLKRKSYGIELDPIYCDLIIDRWEKFTGQKAELVDSL